MRKFNQGDLVLWGGKDKFLPGGFYWQLGIVKGYMNFDNHPDLIALDTINEYCSPPSPVVSYAICEEYELVLIEENAFIATGVFWY